MMKSAIFILLALFIHRADAKSIMVKGKAVNCEKEIRVEAEVGDNNVYAYYQGERYTLFARGNYVFMKESPFRLIFNSYNRRKPKSDSPHLIYTHPNAAMKRGKIEIQEKKKEIICEVELES